MGMWILIMTLPADSQAEKAMKCQEEVGRTNHINLSSHPVRKQMIKTTPMKLIDTHLLPKSALVFIIASVLRAVQRSAQGSAVASTTYP
jgi:hypothetical protein